MRNVEGFLTPLTSRLQPGDLFHRIHRPSVSFLVTFVFCNRAQNQFDFRAVNSRKTSACTLALLSMPMCEIVLSSTRLILTILP